MTDIINVTISDPPVDTVNVVVSNPEPVEVIEVVVGVLDSETISEARLLAHKQEETPHSVYDDIPSLELIFENGLV